MDKKIEIWVLAVILFAGLTYGYYENILKKQIADIEENKKLIEQRQSEKSILSTIKQNKKSKMDTIARGQGELDKLDKAIPDLGDLADFNVQLYYIVKDRGLDIKNVQPKNITIQNGYASQDIGVSFNGNKKDIAGFIDYLKQYPRKIKIKEVKINVLNVDELQVDMTIQVFFIKG